MVHGIATPFYLEQLQRHRATGSTAQYGLQWGDPEHGCPPLRYIRDRWVLPYVNPAHVAVEIGPGGGRWTRYLVGFRQLYVVEYEPALLYELQAEIKAPNVKTVLNNGTDFPGVPMVDFAFSFDVFVHFDAEVIAAYLASLHAILRPGGTAVLHYADQTKLIAQQTPSFADTTPASMRALVTGAGFRIEEEDLTSMWHSSLIRFTPA